MKRKLLVCVLATVMCLSATACGSDSNTTEATTAPAAEANAEATTEPEKDELQDLKDAASDAIDSIADAAAEGINELAGDDGSEIDFSSTTTQEWGDFTIDVPSGMKFQGGDFLDEKDKSVFSVKKSELAYFDFKEEDEQTQKNQYDYNKSTYTEEQKDVSGKIGDIDWEGFQYSDGFGGNGIELKAKVNDKFIRVSATYAFDDEVTQKLLATLKVK